MNEEKEKTGGDRLRDAIRRFNRTRRREVTVDERPGCVFGLMTRDGVDDLRSEVERLRSSVDHLNKLLVGLLLSIALSALGLVLSGVVG